MTNEKRLELLDNYKNAYSQIVEALKLYPLNMWQFKPGPDKWSIHEIIIHIADSEANSFTRCRKIIAENGGTIIAYNQDKWSSSMMYHDQNTYDALELFRFLRKMTYDLLVKLPEKTWANYAMHEVDGKLNLDRWLEIYEAHIPGHINQMKMVYDKWLEQGSKNSK